MNGNILKHIPVEMKKFATLLLVTVLLTRCEALKPEDRYHYLSANYKTDLHAGNTLVFKSNLNNMAEYYVCENSKWIFMGIKKQKRWY